MGGKLILEGAKQQEEIAATSKPDALKTETTKALIDHGQVKADQLDFSPEQSTSVISSATKFIIPVPRLKDREAEPLVYPFGEEAGQPITDDKGNPIGKVGIVFFNARANAVQAAPSDGSSVVIINQVTAAQGEALTRMINQYTDDPNKLTAKQLKAVLEYALVRGLGDMDTSTRDFIAKNMTPAVEGQTPTTADGKSIEAYGLKRDICQAVYVPGSGEFQGPSATSQKFENGAVIVKQGDSIRLVQPEVFEQTYRLKNGATIDAAGDQIKTQVPGLHP